MKKIFYLIVLFTMMFPTIVKAQVNDEIDLEEIHNLISKDNNLEVPSIPLEYYKNSLYYNDCISSSDNPVQQEFCLSYIHVLIVESYLNKTIEVPENTRFFVNGCDVSNNTCKINVSNFEKTLEKEYNVEFVSDYDEKVYKKSEQVVKKLKNRYYLSDMSYINQLINYHSESEYHNNIIYNSHKIFKIFPELKDELEKNKNYKYVPVTIGVGGSPELYGSGGVVVIYDNDVAVNISSQMFYNTLRIVYVPNTTPDNDEEYMKVALERIKEYVNDDSYDISIEKDEQYLNDNIGEDVDTMDVSRSFNYIFNDDKKYEAKFYKLSINEMEYLLGVLPLPNGLINKLNVKSTNYQTGINVETESSDVPLDTTVEAEDVTNKYKEFLKAYDIDLYSGIKEEYITKVKDGIIVRIPMEEDYDKEYVDVYHVKEDGQKGDKYNGKIEEIDNKKYVVFTTNHFSTYAIEKKIDEIKDDVEEENDKIDNNEKEEIKNPATFDAIGNNNFVIELISLIGVIITIIYLKKEMTN